MWLDRSEVSGAPGNIRTSDPLVATQKVDVRVGVKLYLANSFESKEIEKSGPGGTRTPDLNLAAQLLDKYPLRAADSLQLAASLIWCENRPSRRSFICGDPRSAKAAESAGFSILELSRAVP